MITIYMCIEPYLNYSSLGKQSLRSEEGGFNFPWRQTSCMRLLGMLNPVRYHRGRELSVQAKNQMLTVETTAATDVIDLTPNVKDIVDESEIRQGLACLSVPGSTGALTTIEYESGVVNDLCRAIDRLIPQEMTYEHNLRRGDGNGYSHVRAALLGPSLTVPVIDGQLSLGTWRQIVLVDFDNRPRRCKIIAHVIGVS